MSHEYFNEYVLMSTHKSVCFMSAYVKWATWVCDWAFLSVFPELDMFISSCAGCFPILGEVIFRHMDYAFIEAAEIRNHGAVVTEPSSELEVRMLKTWKPASDIRDSCDSAWVPHLPGHRWYHIGVLEQLLEHPLVGFFSWSSILVSTFLIFQVLCFLISSSFISEAQ